jgi:hypothetical protein
MKADGITRLSDLRKGDAFQFNKDGPVWIKSRGGWRLGLGGPLHTCAPHTPVIRYTCCDPIPINPEKTS